MQRHVGLTFYNAYNDQVMIYGKVAADRRDAVVVAVSLDPLHPQDATFEAAALAVRACPTMAPSASMDLMRDRRFVWTGKLQRIRLDPADLPFAIWRVAPLSDHRP